MRKQAGAERQTAFGKPMPIRPDFLFGPFKNERAFLCTTVFALAGCAMGWPAYGADFIKIGDINSYSSSPQIADPYRKGWQLAVEQINASGGVDRRALEVISRDDGQSAVAAQQA